MAYSYPTVAPALPNKLAGSPDSSALMKLALRAGLGVATGGSSEIVSQVLNLIPSIFQGITGASQLGKANKIEAQNPRPTAEVAPAINQLAGYTYGQTLNQDVPGGEMYRNEIKGATAAGLNAASQAGSGAEAYGMMDKLIGSQGNQIGKLAQLTAQDVAGKQGAYENSLGQLGQEQNRVWDWNKAQPYLQAAQIAAQLRDSGMKNLYSGGANAAGAGAEWASPDFNSSILWGNTSKGNVGGQSLEEVMKIVANLKKQS